MMDQPQLGSCLQLHGAAAANEIELIEHGNTSGSPVDFIQTLSHVCLNKLPGIP